MNFYICLGLPFFIEVDVLLMVLHVVEKIIQMKGSHCPDKHGIQPECFKFLWKTHIRIIFTRMWEDKLADNNFYNTYILVHKYCCSFMNCRKDSLIEEASCHHYLHCWGCVWIIVQFSTQQKMRFLIQS